jgi:hypothetical protein
MKVMALISRYILINFSWGDNRLHSGSSSNSVDPTPVSESLLWSNGSRIHKSESGVEGKNIQKSSAEQLLLEKYW